MDALSCGRWKEVIVRPGAANAELSGSQGRAGMLIGALGDGSAVVLARGPSTASEGFDTAGEVAGRGASLGS